MEIWKTIPSYSNYEVSSLGRIRNKKTKYILRASDVGGYRQIQLGHGKPRELVHRLVLSTFVGASNLKIEANHLNGKKDDNRLENLEWVTRSENQIHKCRVLKKGIGRNHGRAKFNEADVLNIRLQWSNGESLDVIAKKYHSNKSTIHRIATGREWKHIPGSTHSRRRRCKVLTPNLVEEIQRRLAHGHKQKDIALSVGLDPSTISNIKTGKYKTYRK